LLVASQTRKERAIPDALKPEGGPPAPETAPPLTCGIGPAQGAAAGVIRAFLSLVEITVKTVAATALDQQRATFGFA
jgi:hypothetical protein